MTPLAAAAPPSRYRWSEREGRYRVASGPGAGRYVAESAVRDALDRVLAAAEHRLGALAAAYRTRQIGAAEWERQMRLAIKDAQLTGYAAARGGWAQLTPADFGAVGAAVRAQYAYLRRFRRELEAGAVVLDGRSFAARMGLYAEAGREAYHAVEVAERERRGYDEYQNVPHAADSCTGDRGCVAMTAAGWSPIGSLVPVGQRTCGKRCRCAWDYRRGAPSSQGDGGG